MLQCATTQLVFCLKNRQNVDDRLKCDSVSEYAFSSRRCSQCPTCALLFSIFMMILWTPRSVFWIFMSGLIVSSWLWWKRKFSLWNLPWNHNRKKKFIWPDQSRRVVGIISYLQSSRGFFSVTFQWQLSATSIFMQPILFI